MQQLPTFALAQAIDRSPLLVEADASVLEVVELMSQTPVDCPVSSQLQMSSQETEETEALAAPKIAKKDVSCVLVIRKGQLSGIITEKDIVRLVAEGRSLTDLSVAAVMSQPVLTLKMEDGQDIFTALAMMRRHRIHHLPVVGEQGQVMGLLTPRRLRSVMAPAEFMRFRRVREVMSTEVIHAFPTATLLHVVQTLVRHEVSCVVIVQPDSTASGGLLPIGIITERDIVQFQRLGLDLNRTQAEAVMSGPLFLVGPQDSLWSVDKTMRQRRVRRLVVADAEGQLAGVVTQGALLPVDPVEIYEVMELLQDKVTQLETEKAALLEQRNQELEDERDRFFSLSPDVFCIVDLNGNYKTCNASLERILGYSTAELASKTVSDLLHPDDRAAGEVERDRLRAGGYKTINYEDRYRCKDGSYRRFLWSAAYEPQQQLIYATARDITEFSQIGKALDAKAKQQSAIARLSQLAVSSNDLQRLMDKVVVEITQTLEIEYCKVLELLEDGESLLLKAGVGWQPGLVGDAIIGSEADSQAGYTLQTTTPVIVTDLRCETRFRGPALLRDHHVTSGMSVIIQGADRPYGILGAHATRLCHFSDEDVAFLQSVANLLAQKIEQIRSKQAVSQGAQDYKTLTENLPGIVYRLFPEENNRMVFLNNQCQSMTGYPAEKLTAGEVCYIDQLILPEDRPEVIATVKTAIAQRESFQLEYGQPLADGPDQPVHVDGVILDVTEQKQLETQFLRAQRLESLGTLASGIAHDLNNIFTPILGVAQLLPMQMPDLSEQIREQLNVLKISAQRGSDIISQVLSFARGAEGDLAILNIKHLISEIKDFTRKTFPKTLHISVDIPGDLWAIEGDATKLYQVFMNLFVNARDAMPQGGDLSVLATNLMIDPAFAARHLDAETGPYILVTVADTGKGIPPDVLEHIFEPFFTTKKSEGGTGLGLSTVHGIVRSHGGFVTVYSVVGRGSQFNALQ